MKKKTKTEACKDPWIKTEDCKLAYEVPNYRLGDLFFQYLCAPCNAQYTQHYFPPAGNSMLRTAVLQVDTKINEISEKVEMKVLGTSSRMETEGGEVRRRRKAGGDDDGTQMADV